MLIYYGLILISIVIIAFAFANIINSKKIEKNIHNYIYIATTSKGYFVGAVIFSLAMLIIVAFQAMPYNFDIRVFSIELFFGSIFLLSLSHLIYYLSAKKKLSDYKEFFKEFEADINNKCHLLMIKHILSQESDIEKIKDIFKRNKHLCEKKN